MSKSIRISDTASSECLVIYVDDIPYNVYSLTQPVKLYERCMNDMDDGDEVVLTQRLRERVNTAVKRYIEATYTLESANMLNNFKKRKSSYSTRDFLAEQDDNIMEYYIAGNIGESHENITR